MLKVCPYKCKESSNLNFRGKLKVINSAYLIINIVWYFQKKCDIDIYTIFWKWSDNCLTIYRQTICRGLAARPCCRRRAHLEKRWEMHSPSSCPVCRARADPKKLFLDLSLGFGVPAPQWLCHKRQEGNSLLTAELGGPLHLPLIGNSHGVSRSCCCHSPGEILQGVCDSHV